MRMFNTIVTTTKSRKSMKYLFKNNDNKIPNAINYHGGLSKYAVNLFNVSDMIRKFIPCNYLTISKNYF